MQILMSVLGLIGLIGLAFLLSENKKKIKWRTIGTALAMQFLLAYLLVTSAGQQAMKWLSDGYTKISSYATDGIMFVFGGFFNEHTTFVFAINVLMVIVFFGALFAVLFYLNVIQFFVKYVGGALSKLLGTTRVETFSAVMNIFASQNEVPTFIKPYLKHLTKAELFAVMVAGTGSMAGSILIGYSLMGIPLEWLLVACFMVTGSSLLVAKLIVPETEESQTNGKIELDRKQGSANIFEAISNGAMSGMQIACATATMLIAFVALIALVNGILGNFGVSLEQLLGYLFYPLAFLMNVSHDQVMTASQLLGQKFATNEFIAYSAMAKEMSQMDTRTIAMLTIGIGGFANFSSIGILLGSIGVLVPEKRGIVAKYGLRAIVAGLLANLISTTIVGIWLL
ncbi:TPA: NupC/NupG family nucleoside CNT transporter [Bacillus cereus]|nr:NupC/NupG family nucleoside CNT transporter [Bacillus cereus]